jgi:hypothetical protein
MNDVPFRSPDGDQAPELPATQSAVRFVFWVTVAIAAGCALMLGDVIDS